MLENYTIHYPAELIQDPEITSYDILVFSALRNITGTGILPAAKRACVTSDWISYVIYQYMTESYCDNMLPAVEESMDRLIQKGHVPGYKKGPHRYHVNPFGLYSSYTKCTYDIIARLATEEHIYLIKPLLTILFWRRMGYDPLYKGTTVCCCSESFLATSLRVSVQTVSRYITTLEDLGILFVYRPNGVQEMNYMGLMQHEDSVRDIAYHETGKTNNLRSSTRKSYTQKYNRVMRENDASIYTEEELLDILDYMTKRNYEQQQKIRKSGGKITGDIRDLSEFKHLMEAAGVKPAKKEKIVPQLPTPTEYEPLPPYDPSEDVDYYFD